jgi:hypothetical protein
VQAAYPTPPKGRMQSVTPGTNQIQAPAAQQIQQPINQQLQGSPARVQQPAPQMQAVHPTTPKERMQYFMHQTQQLQSSAAQQVQQPTHQMQAVYPMPPKERMQSMMQQTQQLQASSQQVQQRTHQMQGIYSTPTKERKQSVSSLSAASPRKRTFEFMENIVPSNFVANPDNHARWTVSPNGDRTYLNGPQVKKARVSRK